MSDSDEQMMPTPSEFGRFLLERELGHGGMGGVYLAHDKVLDRQVALKVMLKSLGADEKFMGRFKVEAQAAAKLIHPSIAQIYSYDVQDGQPYIAMEMVGGGSLMKLMEVNPGHTDITRVMRIGKQIAEALSCAADQGLVHGDVKPENILFDPNGNAKLVDFGLAGMQKTEDPDEIWGTPYYIAPEKIEKKTVDFRADMYSLGATLYHALTGVAPFEGADAAEVVRARFQGDAKAPSAVRADLPAGVDEIVLRMLARDPAARYPTYEALLGDIGRFLAGNTTTTQAVSSAALAPTAAAPAPAAHAPAAKTGRKTVMRVRSSKTVVLKPKRSAAVEDEVDDESEDGAEETSAPRMKTKMRRRLPVENEPEKEGMGLGKMVGLAILGVILLVGGVGGGLVWYVMNTRAQERAAKLNGYVSQQEQARAAISQHAKNAQHFRDEFAEKRRFAEETVQKATNQYLELLEGDVKEQVKAVIVPAETPELIEAIAFTNQIAEAKAAAAAAKAAEEAAKSGVVMPPADPATNAPPAEAAAATNAVPAAAAAPTAAAKAPAEKEVDKDAEAEQALAAAEKGEKPAAGAEKPAAEAEKPAEAAAPEASAEPEKPVELPEAVSSFQALWTDYYTILAADIRVAGMLEQILDAVAKAETMSADGGTTDEALNAQKELMDALAALSKEVGDLVSAMKEQKIVEQALKRSASLRSKAPQLVKDSERKIKLAKAKAEKEARDKAEAEAAAERRRLAEEQHKKLAAEECEKAKAKFANLSTTLLKHLAWDLGVKQMYAVTNDFSTREGIAEAKMLAMQVERMRDLQKFFVAKGRGFKFRKGDTIKEVNMKTITFQKYKTERGKIVPADVKDVTWERFYKENHGQLNELIIGLLEKGRDTTRVGKMEWSNNMLGAALTMRALFSDDPAVPKRIEDIVKKAVKEFEPSRRYAEKFFPEVKLEFGEEDEEDE